MKFPSISLLLVAAYMPSAVGANASIDEKMQNIRTASEQAIVSEAATSKAASGGPARNISRDIQNLSSSLSQIDNSLQNSNYDDARRILTRLTFATQNAPLKKALQELLASVNEEQQKQIDSITGKLNSLTKQVDGILEKTDSDAEIAKVQEQLEDFRYNELSNGSRRTQRLSDKINRLNEFLNQWQRLVDTEAAGNYAQALQTLTDLQYNSYNYKPSSALLEARKQKIQKQVLAATQLKQALGPLTNTIATQIAGIKNAEDASALRQKLSILENSFRNYTERNFYNELGNSLQDYVRMAQAFDNGDYYGVATMRQGENTTLAEINAPLRLLKDNLRIKAMALQFNLPDLGSPAKGQNLSNFLYQKAETALKAQQWENLFSLISAYRLTVTTPCVDSSLKGAQSMLGAIALENAGQFRDAIIEYRNVLREPGKMSPHAAAAEALKRLETAHPDLFK